MKLLKNEIILDQDYFLLNYTERSTKKTLFMFAINENPRLAILILNVYIELNKKNKNFFQTNFDEKKDSEIVYFIKNYEKFLTMKKEYHFF